jgi:NAD(P)H-flavin reductase
MVSVRREATGVTSLYIAGRDLAALRPQPGQFLSLEVPHPRRLVAITPVLVVHRPARQDQAVADHREGALLTTPPRSSRTKPGTRVIAEGPYGAIT